MVLGHHTFASSRMDVGYRLVQQAKASRAPAHGQPMDGQHVAERFEQRRERKVEVMIFDVLLLITFFAFAYFVWKLDKKHMEDVTTRNIKNHNEWEDALIQQITSKVMENIEKKGGK